MYKRTFCYTKIYNALNNNILFTIKIDEEINECINFCRKHKISHSHIIRECIRAELKNKCKEFEFKFNKGETPF